jgi:hypothetical protein
MVTRVGTLMRGEGVGLGCNERGDATERWETLQRGGRRYEGSGMVASGCGTLAKGHRQVKEGAHTRTRGRRQRTLGHLRR